MPQLVNVGQDLLRINTEKNTIEYSQNGGRSWVARYTSNQCGTFRDLLFVGAELLACTSKGLYLSNNEGRSWVCRTNNTSSYGDFLSLQVNGTELLATASKGLYVSKNGGRSFYRR